MGEVDTPWGGRGRGAAGRWDVHYVIVGVVVAEKLLKLHHGSLLVQCQGAALVADNGAAGHEEEEEEPEQEQQQAAAAQAQAPALGPDGAERGRGGGGSEGNVVVLAGGGGGGEGHGTCWGVRGRGWCRWWLGW